jgi:hypothetical protein
MAPGIQPRPGRRLKRDGIRWNLVKGWLGPGWSPGCRLKPTPASVFGSSLVACGSMGHFMTVAAPESSLTLRDLLGCARQEAVLVADFDCL